MRSMLLAATALLLACAPAEEPVVERASDCPPSALDGSVGIRERCLFSAVVESYLADPLWSHRDAYDAAHHLLLPMRAAYEEPVPSWQPHFAEHFDEFVAAGVPKLATNRLARLQYLYLASQFAVIATRQGHDEQIPDGLVALLEAELKSLWLVQPAWQWNRDPFATMRARVEWKLTLDNPDQSYYRAIIDEEHYTFVIAADLVTLSRLRGEPPSAVALDALSLADIVYTNEVSPTHFGGWLFQPGVWEDHRDYAYAGTTVFPPTKPAPVSGVAMDSAHAHRFAFWLRSLRDAHVESTQSWQRYEDLRVGLDVQFFEAAAAPPSNAVPYWRTYNFLDGRNGVFRWNFPTQPDTGYAPYQLSGALLTGWWSDLPSNRAPRMYRELAEQFPLGPDEEGTYIGPNTTRPRNPAVTMPDALHNGFIELLVRLGSRRAAAHPWPASAKLRAQPAD